MTDWQSSRRCWVLCLVRNGCLHCGSLFFATFPSQRPALSGGSDPALLSEVPLHAATFVSSDDFIHNRTFHDDTGAPMGIAIGECARCATWTQRALSTYTSSVEAWVPMYTYTASRISQSTTLPVRRTASSNRKHRNECQLRQCSPGTTSRVRLLDQTWVLERENKVKYASRGSP